MNKDISDIERQILKEFEIGQKVIIQNTNSRNDEKQGYIRYVVAEFDNPIVVNIEDMNQASNNLWFFKRENLRSIIYN